MNIKEGNRIAVTRQLFRNSVNNNEFEEALNTINLLGIFTNINVDIYTSLLQRILGLDAILVSKKDDIFGVKDIPDNIMINYNYAIEYINRQNYNMALRHISVCKKLIALKDIDIDLSPLETILKYICLKSHKQKKENEIKSLESLLSSESNVGYCYYILHKLVDLLDDKTNAVLLLIEACFQLNTYNRVDDLLHYLIDCGYDLSDKIVHYQKEISNFRSCNLRFVDYSCYGLELERLVKSGKKDTAIKLCEEKVLKEDNTMYLYRLAEILFKYGHYDESEELFIKYLSSNNLYSKHVYYYLYFIYKAKSDYESAAYYLSLMYSLSKFKDSNIDIDRFELIVNSYKDNFTSCSIFHIEKDMYFEIVPKLDKNMVYSS